MQLGRAPLWAWAGHRPPGPPLPSPPLATHVLGKDHALKFGGEAPEGFQCQSMPVGHSHQEGEGAAPGVRPGRVGWPQPRLPGTPPALPAATRWLEAALMGRWPPGLRVWSALRQSGQLCMFASPRRCFLVVQMGLHRSVDVGRVCVCVCMGARVWSMETGAVCRGRSTGVHVHLWGAVMCACVFPSVYCAYARTSVHT